MALSVLRESANKKVKHERIYSKYTSSVGKGNDRLLAGKASYCGADPCDPWSRVGFTRVIPVLPSPLPAKDDHRAAPGESHTPATMREATANRNTTLLSRGPPLIAPGFTHRAREERVFLLYTMRAVACFADLALGADGPNGLHHRTPIWFALYKDTCGIYHGDALGDGAALSAVCYFVALVMLRTVFLKLPPRIFADVTAVNSISFL